MTATQQDSNKVQRAKLLLHRGVSALKVSQCTGLPYPEVQRLKREMEI